MIHALDQNRPAAVIDYGHNAGPVIARRYKRRRHRAVHSALRSVSDQSVVAGQDFDDHRINGYHSS
jgi:hypothetical protein